MIFKKRAFAHFSYQTMIYPISYRSNLSWLIVLIKQNGQDFMGEPCSEEEGVGGVVSEIIDRSPDSISENIVSTHRTVMIRFDREAKKPVSGSFSNGMVKNQIAIYSDSVADLLSA